MLRLVRRWAFLATFGALIAFLPGVSFADPPSGGPLSLQPEAGGGAGFHHAPNLDQCGLDRPVDNSRGEAF